jgi:hypothetical protein
VQVSGLAIDSGRGIQSTELWRMQRRFWDSRSEGCHDSDADTECTGP